MDTEFNQLSSIAAVILAGGKGTRMQSETPKVLHEIAGKPMIYYTIEKLQKLGIQNIYVVIGYKAEEVRNKIEEKFSDIHFVYQPEPKGTGDAAKWALGQLAPETTDMLVMHGDDSAFYSLQTLNNLIQTHRETHAPVSMVTWHANRDIKLGRVIRNNEGKFWKILEKKEYEESGLQSDEINCGLYLFRIEWIKEYITKIPLNETGEYYLPELPNIAEESNQQVNIYSIQDENEWVGINTQEELQRANELVQSLSL